MTKKCGGALTAEGWQTWEARVKVTDKGDLKFIKPDDLILLERGVDVVRCSECGVLFESDETAMEHHGLTEGYQGP